MSSHQIPWARSQRVQAGLSSASKASEPCAEDQARIPLPLRPRLRLRGPAALELIAFVTGQADVPIPSVEVIPVDGDDNHHEAMFEAAHLVDPQSNHLRDVTATTLPQTPIPEIAPCSTPIPSRDWSVDEVFGDEESSSDCSGSRPSTPRSTQTRSSCFSRLTMYSEDMGQCTSPTSDMNERFSRMLSVMDSGPNTEPPAPKPARLRRAVWTNPMSEHLWATYMKYLQDPKMTPFRIGKSGIPPFGVCTRVARAAKMTWKGSRPRGGSVSPAPARGLGPYVEWPHSCSITRDHLRELCRANHGPAARKMLHDRKSNRLRVRSHCEQPTVPDRPSSPPEICLSEPMSEPMQHESPLVQMTSSALAAPAQGSAFSPDQQHPSIVIDRSSDVVEAPLGSPFVAKSYGPSSSSELARASNESLDVPPQAHTMGHRRSLGSPARLDQARTSTWKRRPHRSLLQPRRISRPSLGSIVWRDPSFDEGTEPSAQSTEFSSTDSENRDNPFIPRTNLQEVFEASHAAPPQSVDYSASLPPVGAASLAPSQTLPARLGSPFSAQGASHTVPSRRTTAASIDLGSAFRPFATVHRTDHASLLDAEGATTGAERRRRLLSRMAYIHERLGDLQHRDVNAKGSRSLG